MDDIFAVRSVADMPLPDIFHTPECSDHTGNLVDMPEFDHNYRLDLAARLCKWTGRMPVVHNLHIAVHSSDSRKVDLTANSQMLLLQGLLAAEILIKRVKKRREKKGERENLMKISSFHMINLSYRLCRRRTNGWLHPHLLHLKHL